MIFLFLSATGTYMTGFGVLGAFPFLPLPYPCIGISGSSCLVWIGGSLNLDKFFILLRTFTMK